ncbi:hypothetical protein BGX33_010497 [Mortierella sp. NVP41]|nr:hypothetical protein BGX33_010497 [Mortierella sp. NVP41]
MAASVNGTYTRFQSLLTLGLDKGLPTKEMTGMLTISESERPCAEYSLDSVVGPLISPVFEGLLKPGMSRYRTLAQQEQDWIVGQHFWLLLRQNPSLRSLSLDLGLQTLVRFTSTSLVYDVLASMPYLRLFEDCLPETIYSNLQYLEARSKVTSKVILVLLSRLPNLQHLLLGGIEDGSVIDLDAKEILGNRPSRLRTLHLEELEFTIPNGYFATSILPWLPALTKFRTDQLYDTITRGLVAQCQDLQIFGRLSPYYSIGRTVYERKHVVSILLEGCPKLREVDAIHHIITANRLIHSAWSCETRLEKLHCQIVGVERLQHIELPVLNRMIESDADPSSDQEWEAMRRFLESRDQQPQVLGRIARLTQLRILDVGYEYRAFLPGGSGQAWMIHDKPMPDTLELPLDAGLWQLSSMINAIEELDSEAEMAELREMIPAIRPDVQTYRRS